MMTGLGSSSTPDVEFSKHDIAGFAVDRRQFERVGFEPKMQLVDGLLQALRLLINFYS